MSIDRNNWNQPGSWVVALASLWFAFFVALPVGVGEETSDDQIAGASSLEQAAGDVAGTDTGPAPLVVDNLSLPLFAGRPYSPVVARPSTLPAPTRAVLAYAPKQSPPSLMSSLA